MKNYISFQAKAVTGKVLGKSCSKSDLYPSHQAADQSAHLQLKAAGGHPAAHPAVG